jgi:hypothetical protein
MIGIQFGYSFIHVGFSVVLNLPIDLPFNLSTRYGPWPSQSRIISSRLFSFEYFHLFVNFRLSYTTVAMPNSYSSTYSSGSHTLRLQELDHTTLFLFTTFSQWSVRVMCVRLLNCSEHGTSELVPQGGRFVSFIHPSVVVFGVGDLTSTSEINGIYSCRFSFVGCGRWIVNWRS